MSDTVRDEFQYDVFLSHSSKDKEIVRQLAERLRNDGVRVWYDAWEIKAGDDIFLKIEDGLQDSRTLVLLMSANAFGTDWVGMERSTALFRDPTNAQRRFIPLLIQDCKLPDTIRRYRYIDWREQAEAAYEELLEICKPEQANTSEQTVPFFVASLDKIIEGGHTGGINSLALTLDGKQLLSGSVDNTIKLWDLASRQCLATFEGHTESVLSLALTSDGKQLLSGSDDNTIKLWDLASRQCLATFKGHTGSVLSLALMADGKQLLSGSDDHTIKLWDLASRQCLATFEGHTAPVWSLALMADGKQLLSGSDDHTIKLWDLASRQCLATFEGHTNSVFSIALTSDGKQLVSGSSDHTIKLWDLASRQCLATFEGHTGSVYWIEKSVDGRIVLSASADQTIKLWDLESGSCLQTLSDTSEFNCIVLTADTSRFLAGADNAAIYVIHLKEDKIPESLIASPTYTRYTNAKVVLVGDSGVGKSGLGYRLAEKRWVVTESTHGMNVWQLDLPLANRIQDIEREIWLWDLAGQPEYRLVHQLFLDDTALALVLFNPQAEDPFQGLGDWERALRVAVGQDPSKVLVAARTDRGGATVTPDKIMRLCQERGYSGYVATSAQTGEGCNDLMEVLQQSIPWDRLPWISTSQLFKTLKDAIVRIKEEKVVLIRFSELRQRLQMAMPEESFQEEDLRTVIGLLGGQGLVKRLDFGDYILLQPEQLNNYASAVIRAAREHVDGIGCLRESDVLEGRFDFKDMPRLPKADEDILLRAMVQIFLDQSLCIREDMQLVFPSQFNREKEIPIQPNAFVTYRFSGPLTNIYTTLVVRLTYSGAFDKKDLWKNAAEFQIPSGKTLGLVMKRVDEGIGEIKVFFEADIPDDFRVTFIKYIHDHLKRHAADVEREREYACPKCHRPVDNREAIRLRLEAGKKFIACQYCDTRIILMDLIEQKFNEDRFEKKVQQLDIQAGINLDNESRELILVGQAYTITAEAGQIYRQYTNSDHGIDGEIEFKDNRGQASGKKLYLQLKSGDSYLYTREKDGKEIFTVKNDRHLEYWQSQAYPVYLVIRTSNGEIRWMNVSEYLQNRLEKTAKQIVFKGEPFTAFALMKLRDLYIPPSS